MTDQKDQDQKLDSIKLRVEKEQAEREADLPSPLSPNAYSSSHPIKDPEDTLADPHAPEHEWLAAAHELNKEEEKKDRERDREQDKQLKKASLFERKFLIAYFTAIVILCGIALFSGALVPHSPQPQQEISTPVAPHDQATKDIDFSPYMHAVQKAIKSNWHPPKGDNSHVVRVKFKVHKNGEISDLAFDRMSRSPENDAAAIKAIIASMPALPPLPEGSPENVDIQFTFEYIVHH